MQTRVLLFSMIVIFIQTSCFIEHHKENLIGSWSLVEWKIENTGEKLEGYKMDMDFGADERYSVDYGNEQEVGTWRVSGNNLFTHEDGMAEKMVKITYLQNDTLQFEMNRSGRIELVTLKKK